MPVAVEPLIGVSIAIAAGPFFPMEQATSRKTIGINASFFMAKQYHCAMDAMRFPSAPSQLPLSCW